MSRPEATAQTMAYVAPVETALGAKMICVPPGAVHRVLVVNVATGVLTAAGQAATMRQ